MFSKLFMLNAFVAIYVLGKACVTFWHSVHEPLALNKLLLPASKRGIMPKGSNNDSAFGRWCVRWFMVPVSNAQCFWNTRSYFPFRRKVYTRRKTNANPKRFIIPDIICFLLSFDHCQFNCSTLWGLDQVRPCHQPIFGQQILRQLHRCSQLWEKGFVLVPKIEQHQTNQVVIWMRNDDI